MEIGRAGGTQPDRCIPREWFQRPDLMDIICDQCIIDFPQIVLEIKNEVLTQRTPASNKDRVQIRPQKMSIRTRPRQSNRN